MPPNSALDLTLRPVTPAAGAHRARQSGPQVSASVRRTSDMVRLLATLIVASIAFGCAVEPKRRLPPISDSDEIRVTVDSKEIARVSDSGIIRDLVAHANHYSDGWGVPWYGPPVARTKLLFYSRGRFVCDFGLGEGFVTRSFGNFYSQTAPVAQIEEFRGILKLKEPER